MFRSSALFGAMIAVPAALSGQQLRGLIRDAGTNAPLPGAVVTLVDSAGEPATRAIADAQGRFTITTPAAVRAARLHLIRIGYRPRDVTVPPRFDAVLEVAMDRIPPLLETVRVSGRELCPGSAERGAAFALWEQARAGLLAAVVARELKPANARFVSYDRGVSPGDELVRHQTTELKVGSTTRPFVASAGASYFAHVGFMMEVGEGSRIYNAPDADVLLDPAFAVTHCFHLQRADAAHAGQIGLALNPAPGRDELVDVTGVIWMDEAAPQLRSFDFLYTSLEPAAMKMLAGGRLEFRTMPNGVSFIERWSLRLPVLGVATNLSRSVTAGPVRRQDRTDLRVGEINEAGGIVLDATWPDGAAWHAPRTEIAGTVVQRSTNAPVQHAIVTLAGTADSATTDSAGAFRLAVIPGRYSLVAADTLLREFVAEREERRVVVAERDRVTNVRVVVEQVANVVADACNGERMKEHTSVLTGHVAAADGYLPREARVRASWQADYDPHGSVGVDIQQRVQDVPIDERGRFILCGAARERPIQLHLRLNDESVADTVVKVYTGHLTYAVDWRIASIIANGGTLIGIVVSPGSKPLAGADVSVVQLQRHVTADDLGRFQFGALKPGRYTLVARQPGFALFSDTLTVEAKARIARVLTMRPDPAAPPELRRR